ncbi:hypothetical protein SpCBS45565_g05197 [Spizellomyces sp. 'palustris']|nr:hypothetical protein SpCBS45565_g05197 [Spizellomyces sp. 'palustris']
MVVQLHSSSAGHVATASVTMEYPIRERVCRSPQISIAMRSSPVVSPTTSPPPSPPTFCHLRRTPHPYQFTYDAGNCPREKPHELNHRPPAPPSPDSSDEGSRSPRHHRPSQQHHSKYFRRSAPYSQPTHSTTSQQQSPSPSSGSAGPQEQQGAPKSQDEPPQQRTTGESIPAASTRASSSLVRRSLDLVLPIVRIIATAVVVVIWFSLTVYLFYMSYVASVVYTIVRRCPAVLRAAMRGAKRSAHVAWGLGKVAYRAGREAYDTASRLWKDYASPWMPRLFHWPEPIQQRMQNRYNAPPPPDVDEPIMEPPPWSPIPDVFPTEFEGPYTYPTPQASPKSTPPCSPFLQDMEGEQPASPSPGKAWRWSASSGSSGWSFDSGYAEERGHDNTL